jgi:hypothetical protein
MTSDFMASDFMAPGCILVPFVSAGIRRMLLWPKNNQTRFRDCWKGFWRGKGCVRFRRAEDMAGPPPPVASAPLRTSPDAEDCGVSRKLAKIHPSAIGKYPAQVLD